MPTTLLTRDTGTARTAHRPAAAALPLAAAGLILAGSACRADYPTMPRGSPEELPALAPRVVELGASDYTYNAPERIPAGGSPSV
jgi:hypothetical protein